jgi:hypothetical protein
MTKTPLEQFSAETFFSLHTRAKQFSPEFPDAVENLKYFMHSHLPLELGLVKVKFRKV